MLMPGFHRPTLSSVFTAVLIIVVCMGLNATVVRAHAAPTAPAAQASASPTPPAAQAAPPAQSPAPAPPVASAVASPAKVAPQQQDAFYVVGISAHTSNEAESKEGGKIPGLWQQFIQDDTASKIPNKIGDEVYVVYADFTPEQMGTYTYVIGARVSSIDHLPAGMVSTQVPAGRYVTVTSEKGPLPQVIPALWRRIYAMTPEELGGKRAFKGDYEIYNLEGMDPSNSQVDAHVGVQ